MIQFIILILSLLASPAYARGHGIAPAAVYCNFITGIAVGVGASTCVSPLPACDGSTDDSPSFVAFNTWAKAWQSAPHTGQIALTFNAGKTCLVTAFNEPQLGHS